MNQLKVSLIITTFNWPQALDLVFQTVVNQTVPPAEVVLADDGSHADNESAIKKYSAKFPIIKTWQPDKQFRAARARNLALSRAQHEYVIFIDGDCLLPPHFIQEHIKLAQHRKLIAGSRFLINEKETEWLLNGTSTENNRYSFTNYKFNKLALGSLRDLNPYSWHIVRSCNFSAYKDDILRIRGFDESFIGWGREDSDLVVRMLKDGVTIRSGRFASCVAHLYHKELSREQLSVNDRKFKQTLRSAETPQASNSTLGEI